MGNLIIFDPAVGTARDGVQFVAVGGRHTDDGVLANIQVIQDDPVWADSVTLTAQGSRNGAAGEITHATGLPTDVVRGALLELYAHVEAALRKAAVRPDWEPPVLFTQHTLPAFPTDALVIPELVDFVREVSAAYDTPADYAAAGVLAALSGAIGNRRRIHIGGEFYASACLWLIIVGKPGWGKSEPPKRAIQPLADLHAKRREAYDQQREDHAFELSRWEGLPKTARGRKPEAPSLERLITKSTTVEALTKDLAAAPHGMLLYRDEFAGFLASFDQYRPQGGGSDRAFFLEVWSGQPIEESRKTEELANRVEHPFVALFGTIHPRRLRELMGKIDDGFLDRLLMFYPDGHFTEPPMHKINVVNALAYYDCIIQVNRMQGAFGENDQLVWLTDAVCEIFRQRGKRLQALLHAADDDSLLIGAFSKLRLYAGRLTLVLHTAAVACGYGHPKEVAPVFVHAAWNLVYYLAESVRRVHAAYGQSAPVGDALYVLDKIAEKGWPVFSRAQLHKSFTAGRRFGEPKDLDAPLALLCDRQFIRPLPSRDRGGPGRPPTTQYEVNPLWDGVTKWNQFPKLPERHEAWVDLGPMIAALVANKRESPYAAPTNLEDWMGSGEF